MLENQLLRSKVSSCGGSMRTELESINFALMDIVTMQTYPFQFVVENDFM